MRRSSARPSSSRLLSNASRHGCVCRARKLSGQSSRLVAGPDAGRRLVMVQVNMEEARRLLVEGRAVHLGGRLVRFFPSFREVARVVGKHPSSVARWAKREDLLRARAAVLAADRAAAAERPPRTTTSEVEEVLRVVLRVGRAVAARPRPRTSRPCCGSSPACWVSLMCIPACCGISSGYNGCSHRRRAHGDATTARTSAAR